MKNERRETWAPYFSALLLFGCFMISTPLFWGALAVTGAFVAFCTAAARL